MYCEETGKHYRNLMEMTESPEYKALIRDAMRKVKEGKAEIWPKLSDDVIERLSQ